MVQAEAGLGVLHRLTGVDRSTPGDITSVEILENKALAMHASISRSCSPFPKQNWERDLRALPIVKSVEFVKTLQRNLR